MCRSLARPLLRVYTFGFVMMTPQLFINYKLKSVAHLPWRAFMCESLSLLCLLPSQSPSPSRAISATIQPCSPSVLEPPTDKAFNTFIDDAFAWMIEMPTKHRVMTLRDDLIFFVFLYQRHLYPIDKKRANEYGRAYEKDDDEPPLAALPSATTSTANPTKGAVRKSAQGAKLRKRR